MTECELSLGVIFTFRHRQTPLGRMRDPPVTTIRRLPFDYIMVFAFYGIGKTP
jgi:hypothetical protein